MKERISKRTRKLTLCAVLSAFGVLILFLGALIDVLDLTAAMLASLLCIVVFVEAGGAWPWLTYAVTALIAILLLPNKLPAAIYLATGYYPMLKRIFERLPRVLAWVVKLVYFNLIFTAFLFVCASFFPSVDLILIPTLGKTENCIIGYAVCNLVFLLYDTALRRLTNYYFFVLRDRLKIGKNK